MSVRKVPAQMGALIEPPKFQQKYCSIARKSPHSQAYFITVLLLITVLLKDCSSETCSPFYTETIERRQGNC